MKRSNKQLSTSGEEVPLPFVGVKEIPKDCQPEQRYAYRNGAAKLSGSLVKELSRKPEVFRNLADFQPKGGLQQKQIVCGPTGISVEFSSPLQGISNPNYIQQHKRADLINDKFLKESDQDGTQNGKFTKGNSTVIAVDCKWKNGIKLRNAVSGSRSREINPNLKVVDFDFESKMKFTKEMDQICDEYFTQDNVLILEGNKSHGTTSNLKYSLHSPKESEVEPELRVPYNPRLPWDKQDKIRPGTTTIDPHDAENIEHNDLEEHKILLLPAFTKSGFDVADQQLYRFPYTAKFSIGNRKYERSFELQLPLSQTPQHFGLIFTFPEKGLEKGQQQKNVIIKSMISVYSVFPHTVRHASLTVYEFPDMLKTNPHQKKSGGNSNTYVQKGLQTKARLIAKDYLSNMKDNLKEEKLMPQGYAARSFVLNHNIKGKQLCKDRFVHPSDKLDNEYPHAPDGKNKSKKDVMTKIALERES